MAIKRLYGESDDTYNKRSSMTGYTYENSEAKNALRDQIMNRPKFQYDLATDMNYQQAKEQYKALGKIAMNDTIGRATALTGGYANSYATSAGQQAYNNHLKELNESIPQYYAMALDAYNNEGTELLNKYGIYDAEDQQGYARYMDEYNNITNLAQMESADAKDQRDYDYQVARDEIADERYESELAYQRERDAVTDSQWQQSFDYQKESDATQLAYQRERDAVTDDQWEQSYALSLAGSAGDVDTWSPDEYDSILEVYQNSGSDAAKKQITALAKAKGWNEDISYALMDAIESEGILPLAHRTWSAGSDGGNNYASLWNWITDSENIDNNATVIDQYGNTYRLDDLYKQLQETMGKDDAKKYVLKLQKEKGLVK